MQNTSRLKKGFNFLSPFYDAAGTLIFGRQLLASQNYWIGRVAPVDTILVFGGGAGRLIREIELHHKRARICYVDISEKMVAKARKLVEREFPERLSSYQFICGSWTDIPVSEKYQLILTPFVLDCFTEAELLLVMQALKERLWENGQWLFTDFHIPDKGMGRSVSRMIVGVLYFFFRLSCGLEVRKLPAFEDAFKAFGFEKEQEKYFCRGLLTTRVYSLR
jgi:tRNA (cmo5U34)-methyltransferase